MSVVKRSVSIDAEVAAAAEAAASSDGVSFSAWLSEAAERRLRVRDGLEGVAEWEVEAGVLSSEERAAGEALLDRLLREPKPRRARTA
jgi:alkylhydroperoxidase family enzyme